MEAEQFHGTTVAPASRRGQIAAAAAVAFTDRTDDAQRTIAAARRDLRNKLRLAYRVPYHEWAGALAEGDYAVAALLEHYGLKHWPAPSPKRAAYLAEQGRSPRMFTSAPSAPHLP